MNAGAEGCGALRLVFALLAAVGVRDGTIFAGALPRPYALRHHLFDEHHPLNRDRVKAAIGRSRAHSGYGLRRIAVSGIVARLAPAVLPRAVVDRVLSERVFRDRRPGAVRVIAFLVLRVARIGCWWTPSQGAASTPHFRTVDKVCCVEACRMRGDDALAADGDADAVAGQKPQQARLGQSGRNHPQTRAKNFIAERRPLIDDAERPV